MSEFLRRLTPIEDKSMWKDINKAIGKHNSKALFSLGCYCQELESAIHKLEERIARLEIKSLKGGE